MSRAPRTSAASGSTLETAMRESTGVPREGPSPSIPVKPSITARSGKTSWAIWNMIEVNDIVGLAVGSLVHLELIALR